MQWIVGCLSRFVAFLSRIFGVSPETVDKERQENPSPTRES